MSIKRKWLKVLAMVMMAVASFGAPMNPKEIEDLMHIMNETRIEFTIPDEDYKGVGDPMVWQRRGTSQKRSAPCSFSRRV